MEFLQTRLMLAQFGNIKAIKEKSYHSYGHHDSGSNLSCVAEDCHNMMSEYNCSCVRSLPNDICDETGSSDSNIPVVLWSVSAFILFLLILELFAIRFKYSFLDNLFGKLIFSMAIVSSVVTQLCTMQYLQDNSSNITVWYNLVLGAISVFFIMFGFHFLFVKSSNNNIGSHDRGMGLVVVFISTLVVGLEVVLIVMVFKRINFSAALVIYLLVFACEKIVQVVLYILIRRCEPVHEFRRGAVFYFNFLSFLNFTLWLNSITFTDIPIYDEVSHNYILQYVDQTFKALVIDYRLLSALLFLEHALAIDDDDDDGHEHVNNEVDRGFQMPKKRYLYTAIGLGIGLFFLALETINAAQFWHKSLPDFVNLFPIVVDAGLVVLGCLLVRNVNIPVLHDKKVSLVLLMVTSMSAVSIVYLFCFGLLSLTSFQYDQPVSFVRWSACVFLARASSLLVLLLVYTETRVSTMELQQNYNTKNYLFVSSLCFGLFARFIGSILDEFNSTMHEIARQHLDSNKLRSLRDLFAIGPLFQLAASLHLALHFLLMLWRLHERPKIANERRIAEAEQSPGDELGEFIKGIYGAVEQNGHPRQGMREDSAFESTGIHQLDDEHTRLLQPDQQC